MKKARLSGSVQVRGDKVRVIVEAQGNAPIDGVLVNVMVPVGLARLNVDDDSPARLVETDDPWVNPILGPVDVAVVERRMFPPNVYVTDVYVETTAKSVPLRVEVAGLGPKGPVGWESDTVVKGGTK